MTGQSTDRASGVTVGESDIEGLGVFATRAFAAREEVMQLDDSRVVDDEHPLDPEKGELREHCDYLAGGKVVLMPEPERYLNHSCDPNAYVRTVDGVRRLVALRDVPAGRELTIDYVLNTHGGDEWACSCGSSGCRGTLPSSFFELPVPEQLDLLPLLDGWFVEEHADRVEALRKAPDRDGTPAGPGT